MMCTLCVYDSAVVGGRIVKWMCTIRLFKYSRYDNSPVLALQRRCMAEDGYLTSGNEGLQSYWSVLTYSRIHGAGTATMSTVGRH